MADAAGGVPFADLFRTLPLATRRRLVRRHGADRVLTAMMGAGSLRGSQQPPPGDWGIWVILAGRGFGKTHAGAEWVHGAAAAGGKRIALVAPTLDIARAVMVEGESGLLARLPPGQQLSWQPTNKRLVWSNGSEARLYSGAEPNALRGGQFDYAWGDEFAHWAGGEDMLMNLRMATRLGAAPQLPLAWLKALIAEPDGAVYRISNRVTLADGSSDERTLVVRVSPANPAGWDRLGRVEVELIAEPMWLESRSEAAVLAGANLALLGDEIIQFATAEALGNRRFRLSGLLRGRRGTESAVAGHAADERFVLLDLAAMLPLALPLERLGQTVRLRATGTGDAGAPAVPATIGAAAIRPLAPVHLRWRRAAGSLQFSWIAQSRAGFGWPDLTDVPAGEARLAFRVVLRDAAGPVAEGEVTEPRWSVPDRPGPLWLDVAQLGATLGNITTLSLP